MNETLNAATTISSPPERPSLSEAVVEAVADAEGVSPLEVRPPLASVVDPDALDAIFAERVRSGTVEFTYFGYRVRVHGGGDVEVSELDD